MRSIAVANQKGGVGKTTTSVNLAVGLARQGQRVCLVDLDPQAHATLHLGVTVPPGTTTAYDVLVGDAAIEDAIVPASDARLRAALAADPRCGAGSAAGQFDYAIIDCPPSLGLLSVNAMAAADEVLLPLQPHFLALHGLSKLLETIELVADHVHPDLRLLGVVLCLYEGGTRLAAEIGRDVEAFFRRSAGAHPAWREARLFETRIRRNVRLAEAPSFGQSIFDYAPESHGAADYQALALEVDQAAAGGRATGRLVA